MLYDGIGGSGTIGGSVSENRLENRLDMPPMPLTADSVIINGLLVRRVCENASGMVYILADDLPCLFLTIHAMRKPRLVKTHMPPQMAMASNAPRVSGPVSAASRVVCSNGSIVFFVSSFLFLSFFFFIPYFFLFYFLLFSILILTSFFFKYVFQSLFFSSFFLFFLTDSESARQRSV